MYHSRRHRHSFRTARACVKLRYGLDYIAVIRMRQGKCSAYSVAPLYRYAYRLIAVVHYQALKRGKRARYSARSIFLYRAISIDVRTSHGLIRHVDGIPQRRRRRPILHVCGRSVAVEITLRSYVVLYHGLSRSCGYIQHRLVRLEYADVRRIPRSQRLSRCVGIEVY